MKRLVGVAAVLFLIAAAPEPQQGTAPTFLETLDVRITNVDVVVTDKAGKAVRGLRKSDFEVFEDGVPQPIANFAEYSGSSGVAEAVAPAPPAAPVAAEAPAPPPARKFLFFVDEMSLNPKTRAKLTDNAVQLIRSVMQPGDEGMVITPAAAEKIALNFSADRALLEKRLREAIDTQSAYRTNTAHQSEQFYYEHVVVPAARLGERGYIHEARNYATKVDRRVTSTLRTLLGVVGSLNQTGGKKVLVVLSDSLVSQPGREAFSALAIRSAVAAHPQAFDIPGGPVEPIPDSPSRTTFNATESTNQAYFDVRPMIRELAARASADGVTIYSVQPDVGTQISPPGDAPSEHGFGGITHAERGDATITGANFSVTPFQRDIIDGTRETLTTLADATGGKYFIGDLQLADGFRTIADDLSSYYSLAYRDSSGSNAIRKIDVRVKEHPDYAVRARREILRRAPEREMDEMVAANLFVPRDINELGITASAAKPQRGLDSYKIDVAVKIPLDKLTFIPADNNKYRASFSVHYAAADGADYTMGTFREQMLQVPASDIDFVRKKSYTYTSTLVVAPGTAKIAVGVYDKFSRLSGFQRLQVVAR